MKSKLLKKTLSIILSSVLILGVASCGKDETVEVSDKGNDITSNNSDVTKLSMAWWGNQVRNEGTQKALDKYTEIDTSIVVEGQFYQWDDYWGKLSTLAAGNSMPDILQMDFAYLNQYKNSGLLLDLTPYIESGALDLSKVAEDYQIMGVVDGGNYAICAGVNSPAMFYNKTLTDELGIEVKDYMTLDEFITISKEVHEKTGYKTNLFNVGNYMDAWTRSNDIKIADSKMGAASEDGYVEYFELLESGINEGWVISLDLTSSSPEQDPLVYGSTPETSSWISMYSSNQLVAMQNAAPEGVEIGITTVPTNNVKKSNYLKPSQFFSISANTENPDEAVAVLNFLINSVEANEILLAERGVPINSEVGEAISPLLSEETREAVSYINDVIVPNCSPIGAPDPSGYGEVRAELQRIEEEVAYGVITPVEASARYYTKGNEIFASK